MTEKKLCIKTYGCQMNVYDSVRIGDVMAPHGYTLTDQVEGADLVILNTCHIREKASEKVYSELGRIREEKDKLKAEGKQMLIAVAGCVAQAEGAEIVARAPYVDIVVGPQAYQRLPVLIENARNVFGKQRRGIVELEFAANDKFDSLPEEATSQGPSAFLTIQEGCDKFCTFCVVPYTRGAEFSRTGTEIYREALRLVQKGSMEITLLGQNVNAFHGKGLEKADWDLGTLIRHLAEIDGLERIRYTTSHPRDVNESQIAAHAEVKKLMPFLHLPVQSGSDRMLKEMNRKHTVAEYLHTIAEFRKARPDIAFSSDFIVGFPGETEQDFEDTLQLVREVGYAQAYSFKYSARPGTPAAMREDTVPEEVKSERLARLQQLINTRQLEYNRASIGMVMPILLDKHGHKPTQMIGRSPYMQSVHVMQAEDLVGKIIPVRITGAHANSLSGDIAVKEVTNYAEPLQLQGAL